MMREPPDVTKAESLGELGPVQRARAQLLSCPPHPWEQSKFETDTELHLVSSESGPTWARRCMLELRNTAQQTPSPWTSNRHATKSERALLGENPKTYAASGEDGRLAPRASD